MHEARRPVLTRMPSSAICVEFLTHDRVLLNRDSIVWSGLLHRVDA